MSLYTTAAHCDYLIMVLSLVLLLTTTLPGDMVWGGNDFVQYYVAAGLLRDGENPYDRKLAEARQLELGRSTGVATFAPPWGLLPALALTGLPFQTAVAVNVVMNLVLLVLCATAWIDLLFPGRPRLMVALIALPVWMPCLAVVGIGQLSLWPLAGFTGWLWLTTRGRHNLAAAVLALTLIKPHLGLLPGLFVAARWVRQRQWTPVVLFLAAFLGLTAVTLWLRPAIWTEYFQGLSTGIGPGQFRTATLDGWGRETLGQEFRLVSWAVWGIALAWSVRAGWRWPEGELCSRAPVVTAMALATAPYAFSFDFVFLLPGFLLAAGRMLANVPGWRWGMAAWLALEGWMVAGKLVPWEEAAYWFVPWLGLGVTAWLVRRRAS